MSWGALVARPQRMQFNAPTPQAPSWTAALQPTERAWILKQDALTQDSVRPYAQGQHADREMVELQLYVAGYRAPGAPEDSAFDQQLDEFERSHPGVFDHLAELLDDKTTPSRKRELERFFDAEMRTHRDFAVYADKKFMDKAMQRVRVVSERASTAYQVALQSGNLQEQKKQARLYEMAIFITDRELNLFAVITSCSKSSDPDERTLAKDLLAALKGAKETKTYDNTINEITKKYGIPVRS